MVIFGRDTSVLMTELTEGWYKRGIIKMVAKRHYKWFGALDLNSVDRSPRVQIPLRPLAGIVSQ